MPDNNSPLRSFKFDGQVFDIPDTKVQDFLKDMPDAEEVRSFTIDKDTFDIPVQQVQSFIKDAPQAKPLHNYVDIDFDGGKQDVDYGPFDKETIEKSPQARQNFERWQKEQEQPEEKERSFLSKLGGTVGNELMTGINQLNSWAADAPAFIYDLAGAPFRAVGLNVPKAEDFKGGALENVSDFYKNNAKAYEEKVKQINPNREEGVVNAFQNGNIETGVLNLAGSISESMPASIALMLSGGAVTPTILASGAIFGAGKVQELDENAPEMDYDKRRLIGAVNGTLEGVFETWLGAGAAGRALSNIIKKEGKDVAEKQVKRSLATVFSDMLTKNPWLAPMGEGFEEIGTQLSQNIVDKYSGYRPDIEITEGVGDAFLAGVGMGGIQGSVIRLAQQATKEKGLPLPGEEKTPQLSPRDAFIQQVQATTQQFLHEDGSFTTIVDETGKQWQVKATTPGTKGEDYLVYDPESESGVRAISSDNIKGEPTKQSPDEVLQAELSAFDQMQQQSDEISEQIVEFNGKQYINLGEAIPGEIGLQEVTQNSLGQFEPVNSDPLQIPVEEFEAYQQEQQATQQTASAEQPQQQVLNTTRLGKNDYKYTVDEDGAFNIQIPEGTDPAKAEKEIRSTIPEKEQNRVQIIQEQVEKAPTVPWGQPTVENIVKGIKILPSQQQNVTGATSQDGNMSEIAPKLQQHAENETQPSYTFKGQEIDRETAQGLIEVAALQGKPEKLNGLILNNDPELTELLQTSFPEKKPSYKLGNKNITPVQARAAIIAADTPEELTQVKIANDSQFDELIQAKNDEFKKIADENKKQENREHDGLVTLLRVHNNLTPGKRRLANTAGIVQKASKLGYNVKTGKDNKLIITDANGSEIRYRPDNSTNEDKTNHKIFDEYSEDFKNIASNFLIPGNLMGVEIGLSPKQISQAILDVQAGKKTVGANKLLDGIEEIINSGIVRLKGDNKTGQSELQISLDEHLQFISEDNDLTEEEELLAETIPEDVAEAIIFGYEDISPEIYNELFNDYLYGKRETETGVQDSETDETDSGTEPEGTETGQQEIKAEVPKNENNFSENQEKLTETENQEAENEQIEVSETEKSSQKEKLPETDIEKSLPKQPRPKFLDERLEKSQKEQSSQENTVTWSEDDVNYQRAYNAYSNISFDPEKRAKSEQEGFVKDMDAIHEKLSKLAKTPEQQEVMWDELVKYKDGYLKRLYALLDAKSRTLSSMITGPANFPTARNEKALRVERKRLDEFLEWTDKAENRAVKSVKNAATPEQKEDEAWKSIKNVIIDKAATIISIDTGQNTYTARPLIVQNLSGFIQRMFNNGQYEHVIKSLDYLTELGNKYDKPIISGKSKIWDLREQSEKAIETEKNKPTENIEPEIIYKNDDIEIVNNKELERVQIVNSDIPPVEIRNKLKSYGFKWSPRNKAWQRKNTPDGIRIAKKFAEENYPGNIINENSPEYRKLAESEINAAYGSEGQQREAIEKTLADIDKTGELRDSGGRQGVLFSYSSQSGNKPTVSTSKIKRRTVPEDFKESGYVDFIGRRIESPQDIADLWAIHRSPYIEKIHAIFVKDGRIVGTTAQTTNHLSSTAMFNPELIANLYNKYEADGFYLLHNHPSGNHKVSAGDVASTSNIQRILKKDNINLIGHVVIDTDKFSYINISEKPYNGAYLISEVQQYMDSEVEEMDYPNVVPLLFSERENIGNGVGAQNRMMEIGKALLTERGYRGAIIYLSRKLDITGYDIFPENATSEDIARIAQDAIDKNIASSVVFVHDGSFKHDYYSALPSETLDFINAKTGRAETFRTYKSSIDPNELVAERLWEGKPEYKPKFLDERLISISESPNILEEPETNYGNNSNFLDDRLNGASDRAREAYKERQNQLTFKEQVQKIREFWQDINLPIRKLEEEIKKRGGKQYNRAKPYRDINLSFGRMEQLYNEFTEEKMKPILDAIGKIIKNSSVTAEDILPYIISKHAPERNRELRKAEFDKWVEASNDPSQDERDTKWEELEQKDYSGVRGFDPENTYDNPDELANLIVAEIEAKIENKELIGNLWKQINNATDQILEHWKDGGQISEKMYNQYKQQYDFFVPLRGWRHGAAKQLRYQKGQGFGKSLKHAEGRKSLADNPLAYIQAVAFKSIGERVDNEIKNSLLNLVLTNYKPEFKDLYHIKKVYYTRSEQYNPETGENEEVWDATLIKPSEEMFDNGDAKSEYYGEHMKLRSKFEAFQHEVIVHREGGDVAIVFEGDQFPVAQAFNRQNTMFSMFGNIQDAQHWNLISKTWPAQVTQFMKRMFTSTNPVFPFTNFFRDVPEAAITLWVQDQNPAVMKNVPKAMRAIRSKLWGNPDMRNEIQQHLRDFYESGGATGFTHEKSPEQIEKDLTKELKRILRSDGLAGKSTNAVNDIFKAIQKWNQLFEDTTRFAVYLSSIQAGKSKEDAAMDAKEASVNFNRKGKGTKMLDSVWAFFNPAIQAAQKNFKLAKDHPGRFGVVALSVTMAGFIEALLNDLGGDDDEYYRLNEYVRHNYAVIGLPGEDKYIRIPLPQFWRGFHSLGVITYDLMKGKTNTGQAVANTTMNFMGGLSPIDIPGFWVEGEFSLTPIVPTFAKPPVEAFITNRNFMQSQIAKEPFTKALEEQLAESSLHKKNVNPAIKAITDFLSKDVGGKYGDLKVDVRDGKIKKLNYFLDWNPSKIEHLFTSYTGGTGRVLSDMTTTISQMAMADEEIDVNNIPFVNSFIRNTPDEKWKIVGEYYDLREMTRSVDAVKNYAKRNKDYEKYREVSLSELNVASKVMDVYDKRITDLIKKVGMDDEEGSQKAVDLMQTAVERVNKILE